MKCLFEKINAQQLVTICFLGAALLLSTWAKQENLAITIGSGLVGYLGGVATNMGVKTDKDGEQH